MIRDLLIFFGAIVLLASNVWTQPHTILPVAVTTAAWPKIEVSFVAWDNDNRRVVDADRIHVRIGNNVIPADSIVCPPTTPPLPLSSVLCIDVSGSMSRGGPNIALAREAARSWIIGLSPGSECAITSFDNRHYINADFSSDTSALLRVLPALVPRGGTSYEEGLLGAPFGALGVAADGRNKRVVVLLTDGTGTLDIRRALDRARAHGTTVYCVSLGMPMPDVLKQLADSTGGQWFDNVTTIREAVAAYQRIAVHASAMSPCRASFIIPSQCSRTVDVVIGVGTDSATQTIFLPDSLTGGLAYTTGTTDAGVIVQPTTVALTLTSPRVESVVHALTTSVPYARIISPALPITLPVDSSVSVVVEITPPDSTFGVITVQAKASPCPPLPAFITHGSRLRPSTHPTIRVVWPNGGEQLLAGSTVELLYDGLPSTEPVRLQVSLDGGRSYATVAERVSNGLLRWRVTDTTSSTCLLRVVQDASYGTSRGGAERTLRVRGAQAISMDGEARSVATVERQGQGQEQVSLWDLNNEQVVATFPGFARAAFLPSRPVLLIWKPGTIAAVDARTGKELWQQRWPGLVSGSDRSISREGLLVVTIAADSIRVLDALRGSVVMSMARTSTIESPIAMLSLSGDLVAVQESDSTLAILSVSQRSRLATIHERGSRRIYTAVFHPYGDSLLLLDGTGSSRLVDAKTGAVVRDLGKRYFVNDNTYAAFNAVGDRVALERGKDQTTVVDPTTGRDIVTIQRTTDTGPVVDALFSPDGTTLALLSFYRVSAYDASTGVSYAMFKRAAGTPVFHPDGNRVLIIDSDSTITLRRLRPDVLQQDVSDAQWSIVRSKPTVRAVRFGPRHVATSKDSVVSAFIVNTGNAPATVTSMKLDGLQAADFGIRSSLPISIAPGDSVAVELAFQPSAEGERATLLVAEFTDGKRVGARITGRALPSILSAESRSLDFGDVRLGSVEERSVANAIKNTGKTALVVTSVRRLGPDDSSFAVMSPPNFRIQPGSSHTVHAVFHPTAVGRRSGVLAFTVEGLDEPLIMVLSGTGIPDSGSAMDPTTFRSILLPTSIVPKAGTITTGSYNLIGASLGASITDNIMVLGGGALPISTRWVGKTGREASTQFAWTLGAKAGFRLDETTTIGGGYQGGVSWYDQDHTPDSVDSEITFHALWGTAGFGTDDSRLNVTLGYAFKYHDVSYVPDFVANATIIGLAYDYRVSEQWKVCAEAFFMRTMSFVPVTITARYFGETYALEAGLMVTGIPASGAESSVPVIPMLSWVKRW